MMMKQTTGIRAGDGMLRAWGAAVAVGWCLCSAPAFAGGYLMPITFGGYTNKTETLTNFPVLVVLSNNVGGASAFNYNNFLSTNGWDLRFKTNLTTTATNTLNYEVETWNTNGASYVWVQVPLLLSNGLSSIWATWGDSSDSNRLACTTNGAVWSSRFALVEHMSVSNGTTVADSSTNNQTATIYNDYTYTSTGAIGGALNLTRTADRNNGLQLVSTVAIGSTWTISCWFNGLLGTGDWRTLARGPNGNHQIIVQDSSSNLGSYMGGFNQYGSATLPSSTDWRHLEVVGSGGTTTAYVNGQPIGTGNFQSTEAVKAIGYYQGGSQKFASFLDEFRIETVASSSNWIWACYMNSASNTAFQSYGAATTANQPVQMKISFGGYTNRAETLTNFPVLVVLSNNVGGASAFSYNNFLSTNGWDLRFKTSLATTGTNTLNYEIESWNPGGASYVWVQLPSLASNGTSSIWATWGDSSDSTQLPCTTNGAVWTNSYLAVWHLDHTNSAGKLQDSTPNHFDGVDYGSAATNGPVGRGRYFSGSSSYIDISTVVGPVSSYTVNFWVNTTSGNNMYVLDSQTGRLVFGVNGGAAAYYDGTWRSAAGSLANGQWHNVVFALDSGSGIGATYLDGVATLNNSYAAKGFGPTTTLGARYGNSGYSLIGSLDDVHIASVARSTNWIWAAYMNIASNTPAFQTYGPATVVIAGNAILPSAMNLAVSNVLSGSATFNGQIMSTGSAPVTVVAVCYGQTDGGTNGPWANTALLTGGSWTNGAALTTNMTLTSGLDYYYTYYVSNSVGGAYAPNSKYLITGPLTVSATDASFGTTGSDTATIVVSRPATCTGSVLTVYYTTSGDATNGVHYTASPASGVLQFAAGATTATITLTPVLPLSGATRTATVTLSATGAYPVGSPASASATEQLATGSGAVILWSDGDGNGGWFLPAVWNNVQAALTSAGNNPATPGTVKLSGDFSRTVNDASVGSLKLTNANITLSGGWDATFTTQSGRSILDVKGANNATNAFRVLDINATNIVVQNVVVTNGYTPYDFPVNDGGGGGIRVRTGSASIILQNLVVANNACPNSYNGGGGGIGLSDPVGVRISDCSIIGNTAYARGGAIEISQNNTTPTVPTIIERCTILNNKTLANNGNNSGGALDASYVSFGAPYLIMANCAIVGNASKYGSGISLSGYGSAQATIFGCLFASNCWNTTSAGAGNALFTQTFHGPARLVNCTVADNIQTTSPGQPGIYFSSDNYNTWRLTLINSITKSNDFGFYTQRKNSGQGGVRYVDFQNTTVQEPNYVEFDSSEANLTNSTLAAAMSTTGNATPAYEGLDSSGTITHTMQQNIDGSANFSGQSPTPYRLATVSANALDNGITKLDGRGFTYVDVDLNGSYTPMVDIIVANAPAGWSSSNLVYTTDMLGNPRLIGAAIDRGAYELKTLSYNGAAFAEAAANDGSISNSLTVTLLGDTFNATVGQELVTLGKVTTNNVPAGLQVTITNISSTQAVITLTGRAVNNTANDSVANLTINFLDGAFTSGSATYIAGASRADLQVNFFGAAGIPVLTYSGTNFPESAANDGSITNALTVTLTNDTFTASPGITVANYPAGLVPAVTRLTPQTVSIGFTGNALLQRAANTVTNLTVTFLDSAFSSSLASTVSNSVRSDLQITFQDPVLTYSGSAYSEATVYDGSISNTLTLTLAGDGFNATNNENLVASGKVLISNVPVGLTAVVTRNSAQTATASLTGKATPHNAANSVGNLTFAFQNAAFANGAAAAVTNAVKSNLTVSFVDPILTYSGTNFTERWQNDGGIGNTLTITLAYDSFNGAIGQDLIALGGVTPANVPGGLTASVTVLSSTQVVAALNGNATSHTAANSIANLGLTFQNSAFSGGVAAAVTNASGVNLAVTFLSQNAADLYVSTTGNDTNSGTLASPFATVAKAVAMAQTAANDVIHLLPGIYTQSGINVGKVVTITGDTSADTILQAAATPFTANAQIMSVGANGAIKNLTLQYGNTGSAGGAISQGSFDFIYDSCRFASNSTTSEGGALWGGNGSQTITFLNCQFVGNRSSANGGAISVFNLNIFASNCTFVANVTGGSGGAILRGNPALGKITVYDSLFSGNAATNNGGTISASKDTTVTIWNSTLSGNRAVTGSGGAIYGLINDGSVTCLVYNSTITLNTAGGGGGGIYHWTQGNRQVILYNSTVFANTAGTTGGGIWLDVYGGNNAYYNLYSSIVASNTAANGPDIYANGGGAGTVTNSLLGNNANAGGSGVTNGSYIGTSGAPVNPQLLPLAGNGGARPTCALAATSPAINGGVNLLGINYDGRGASYARVVGAQCDMGAYEWGNGVLTYSTNAFNETMPANDGTINTNAPLIITLNNDASFATGVDFVSEGKLIVSNLPAGLTGVATRVSSTNLSVILTGAKAAPHNASNSVTNLTFIFMTNAFVTGTMADNPTNATLQVLFQNNFVTVDNAGGATNLSVGVAGLRGTVHNGQSSTVFVGWGPVDGSTNQTWANTNTLNNVSDETAFTNTVSSLLYGMTYYYTCWATNQYSVGAAPASTNFATLRPTGAAISLANAPATGLTATSAVLNATLACSGAVYNALVYWGTNNAGTNATAWINSASLGWYTNLTSVSLSYTANGLAPNVTNYYTFRATNALDGVWDTNVLNVRTYILSADNAGGATNVSPGVAGLRGTVYNGLSSTVFVGWGPVDGGTNRTWANTNTLSTVGDGAVFTNTVSNLLYGVTYYYCCWATNLYSTASAPASTGFFTLRPGGTAIALTNLPATGLTANSAVLNATLGCSGAVYNALVYWGTNNAGTNAAAWANSAMLGGFANLASTNLSYSATALAPNTTNYFAFRATNALDSVWATNVLSVRTFILSVDNAAGATNMSVGVSGLRGTVFNGQSSTAFVGWGPVDGGTNKTWASTNTLPNLSDGAVFTNAVNGLLYGVPYYYCCWATNLYSAASAPASTNFISLRPTNAAAIFLTNAPASGVTATAAVLNATMACSGSVYNVIAYWNTVNGQTNAVLWTNSAPLGWFTNLTTATPLGYTATGLPPNRTIYFAFQAMNAAEILWATNVLSFQTPVGTPAISNLPPTNVTTTSATMNGYLAITYGPATVSVLYGPSDGGMTPAWANTYAFTPGQWAQGSSPTAGIGGLTPNSDYYYTCAGADAFGTAYATNSQYLITGPLTIQSTDASFGTNGNDTATFVVSRPASCTGSALTVYYTTSGDASNGVHYAASPASGSLKFAAGATTATLTLTPASPLSGATRTATVTLAPGAYPIGSPASASATQQLATAGSTIVQWSDGDGGFGTIYPAVWNDIQTALTSAGNNPSTPGTVRLSGDFARTANDATVGSLKITNANVTLSGGWDVTFMTHSGRSILNVSGANSASNQFRVLSITASNVVVQNVQAINGWAANNGGAGILISSAGPGVQLQNLVVTNNACPTSYSGNNGGGIYFVEADAARVSDCTISGNQTSDRGGGIEIFNSAVIPSAPVVIERCTIRSNKTISSNYTYGGNYGGGIDLAFSSLGAPNVVVANCTIDGNQSRYGSGINIDGYGGAAKATVFGCLITSNSWNTPAGYPGDGNGICVAGSWPSPARFVNCTVANNTHPTTPGQSGIYLMNGGNQDMRGSFINCATKSNDFGVVVVRYSGSRVRYADFQNTTVQEAHYLEVDSSEGNLTNATLAGAISTIGNPNPGYTGLDSTGGVTHLLQQNQDGDPGFNGSGTAPYQLSATSRAKDTGITKLDSRGFTYVDVDLNGSYTPMVDIIVANAPAGWSSSNLVYTTDLLGNPRVLGPAIDSGAYEAKSLSYSGSAFVEGGAGPAGDGSISNSLTVTVLGDTFNATNNENLVASGKVTTNNIPAGLTAAVTVISSTQAVVTLAGNALKNTANDSIANLTLNFLDASFGGGSAASIGGASRSDLQVNFFGAAGSPALTYSGITFMESAANDGSISNALLVTLTNESFTASPGVTVATYPANLVPVVTRLTAQMVSIGFTGNAVLQRAANNITNVAVTFLDSAFVASSAASVSNYTRADLQIAFLDPVLNYSGTTFTEAGSFDGSIGNALTLALAGDAFNATNNENLVASGKVLVSNLPAGLTAVVTRASNAQMATASLSGRAAPHNAANSVGNLTFAFLNTAFANGAAAAVTNAVKANLAVSFPDPILTYSGTNFTERWQNDGGIGNTLTISLTYDLFAGAIGQDLVALGRVIPANVPAGLTAAVTVLNSTQVVAALNGNATSHTAANNIANLGLTFMNGAFAGGLAAAVTNASGVNLAVTFLPANATDLYVGPTGSDSTGNGTAGNPYATVAKAISMAQAAANDVIHLLPGTYTQNNINVSKFVTITGNSSADTILQAAAAPFTASASIMGLNQNCCIRNLTLQNGYGASGGALNYAGGEYHVDNCLFANNGTTSSGDYSGGGAINIGDNVSGTLYLNSCQFTGNHSAAFGGAIRSWNPTLWISNCVFSGNSAARDGGAVYAVNGSSPSIYDSSFLGNAATNGNGGGVVAGAYVSWTARGCTFASNSAAYGGAVCDWGPTFVNCTFYGNSALREGGAFYSGIYGSLAAYNSTFFQNAALTGGAIRISSASGGYTLYSCIVAGNTAAFVGQDILWANGNHLCYNCLIGNNANSGLAAASPDANTNYIGTASVPIDPKLLPLANNGGLTLTCALKEQSPAVDHGSNPFGLTTDQRGPGFARIVGSQCDMGAFEFTVPGTVFKFR